MAKITNANIQAGLENGTIAVGTGMILCPDGKVVGNEGNIILPASADRAELYKNYMQSGSAVVKLEDLDSRVSALEHTYTADDVGKVMTVLGKNVIGDLIVPEQTVTLDDNDEAVLANVDVTTSARWIDGAVAYVAVNGETYTCTFDDGWLNYDEGSVTFAVALSSEGGTFYSSDASISYTVSVNLGATTYELQPDIYGGADIVIESNAFVTSNTSLATSNLTLVRGNYSDLESRIEEGLPISACVYYKNASGSPTVYSMTNYLTYVNATKGYGNYVAINVLDNNSGQTIYLSESGLTLSSP